MAGSMQQVKARAKHLTVFFTKGVFLKRGVRIVGDSWKKGWMKVKNIRRRR